MKLLIFEPLDHKFDTAEIEDPIMKKLMKFGHVAHQGILGEMSLFPFIKDKWYQP